MSIEIDDESTTKERWVFFKFAAGDGFEPSYSAPKADVLPLDDPAMK